MNGKHEPVLGTALVLSVVNLAMVVAAPLVAFMAARNGDLGVIGWFAPVLLFATVLSVSVVIVGERLAGRSAALWLRVALVAALVLSAWAVIAEAVAR